MPLRLIGLTGRRGAGKDTAATALVEKGWVRAAFADPLYQEVSRAYGVSVAMLQGRLTKELPQSWLSLRRCADQGFVLCVLRELGVSRVLRREYLAVACGRSRVSRRLKKVLTRPLSPRSVLQWWGTEYRRVQFGDDYWREQLRKLVLSAPDKAFVITDVRFPDEARLISTMGGVIARVVRPSQAGETDGALMHASEQAMLGYPVALEWVNREGDDGLQQLKAAVVEEVTGSWQQAA